MTNPKPNSNPTLKPSRNPQTVHKRWGHKVRTGQKVSGRPALPPEPQSRKKESESVHIASSWLYSVTVRHKSQTVTYNCSCNLHLQPSHTYSTKLTDTKVAEMRSLWILLRWVTDKCSTIKCIYFFRTVLHMWLSWGANIVHIAFTVSDNVLLIYQAFRV